jgi:hypothetical protein
MALYLPERTVAPPQRRLFSRRGGLDPQCCDLPRYAELCDRVDVVRDLDGLDRATDDILSGPSGLAGR